MSAYAVSTRGLAGRKVPQGTLTPMGALLFGSGEQGAWYDPSDMSTLFQDSAGTTPVTAVEQLVGRMLDKSGRGNHASQDTTTKRPVLSRRVNLWTNTNFRGAVAGSPGTAPTGWSYLFFTGDLGLGGDGILSFTSSATRSVLSQALSTSPNTSYVLSVKVNANTGLPLAQICTFNQALTGATELWRVNGTVVSSNSYVPVAGDLITGTLQVAGAAGTINPRIGAGVSGVTTGSVSISQPSITLATDAHLPYQRVNTATDYDADPTKFPAYLRFDGVDDALVTGNIDFTSTDKMTVWAGVLRASTSTAQEICGLTASPVNAGAFTLWASTGADAGVSNTQAAFSSAISGSLKVAAQTLTHNTQAVLNGYQNSTGVNARLNSGAINTVAAIPVANFANAPIYIGSRAGTSLYFNGRLYPLIIRGAQSSLSQLEAGELYTRQKMRMP